MIILTIVSSALLIASPVAHGQTNTVSFRFQGTIAGSMTSGQIRLTKGIVNIGNVVYSLTGTPTGSCGSVDIVCVGGGVLSAGDIQLSGTNVVMGLASCYSEKNHATLSLTFYPGEPPVCGGTTCVCGSVHFVISAIGTLHVHGSKVVIKGTGTLV